MNFAQLMPPEVNLSVEVCFQSGRVSRLGKYASERGVASIFVT